MMTGIISVFLAVLPMGIAFAGGTPLQGSLGWGLSVINGGKSEEASSEDITMEEMAARLNENSKNNIKSNNAKSMQTKRIPAMTETPEKIKNTWNMMAQRIGEFIINLPEQWCAYAVLIGIAVVILLGLIFIILRKTTYGEMLMSAGFCMGILTLLLCASGLGLPMLMDPARCSIYYVYLLILTLTVLMDGILYLIFMRRLFTIPRSVLSFILTVSIVGSMIHQGMIKMPGFGSDYVSNGALTCLSNIIKENEDKTWTIVSANDETQMGLDHGWHYETITFLRNMEYMNKDTKGKMDSDVPDVLLGTGI